MKAKQRFLAALARKKPDRLPVTTHHVIPYFLEHTMHGISNQEFFDHFGLDPILWVVAHRADSRRGEFFDHDSKKQNSGEYPLIGSEGWIIESENLPPTAVRSCFEDAGDEGGYILAPSDHFFEADIDLLKAFADEAKKCVY